MSPGVDPILFCFGFTYNINSGGIPSLYAYYVIAAPYVSVVSFNTITLLMMIWNIQWTMSSLESLKCFSLIH